MNINALKGKYSYAMHGLGAFKGLRQTNTMDAFNYWHRKGIKVFEIDFARTIDEKYVAVAHSTDDKSLHRLEITDLPVEGKRTQEWFMSQKLFQISTKGLTPISLETCLEIIQLNEDCIFMFDLFGFFSKEDCYQFADTLSKMVNHNEMWDRILLEAYSLDMAEGLLLGATNSHVIYCVRYENNIDEKNAISTENLLNHRIKFVSYPWKYVKMFPGEIEKYSKAGFTVFSRTKYNTNDKQLKKAGVSVNIIANRFDRFKIVYQYPLYILTYIKRLYVKLLLKKRIK